MAVPLFVQSKSSQLVAGVLVLLWVLLLTHDANSLSSISSLVGSSSPWTTLPETTIAITAALGGHDAADTALVELCQQKKWHDGLWLTCHGGCGPDGHSICGGLNNARNRVQTCVRLAIDIGAGVKFPRVTERDATNLLNTGGNPVCPDQWFDMQALTKKMGALCPRMRISPCDEAAADVRPERIVDLPKRMYNAPPSYNNTFSEFVAADLAARGLSLNDTSTENPMMLRFVDPYLAWDYRRSSELYTVRKALFRALPFNATLSAISNDIFASEGLRDGNYFGIHLRAEADWPRDWGSPEQQMDQHAAAIRHSNQGALEPTTDIYVSCGDRAQIQVFRELMAGDKYVVHDKWTLLADRPATLDVVERLPFDSKGVVEHNVLARGRYFQGHFVSTLSMIVAYTRTMDQPDFFNTSIYAGSSRSYDAPWNWNRYWPDSMTLKGDNTTKLFVVSGADVMDQYP